MSDITNIQKTLRDLAKQSRDVREALQGSPAQRILRDYAKQTKLLREAFELSPAQKALQNIAKNSELLRTTIQGSNTQKAITQYANQTNALREAFKLSPTHKFLEDLAKITKPMGSGFHNSNLLETLSIAANQSIESLEAFKAPEYSKAIESLQKPLDNLINSNELESFIQQATSLKAPQFSTDFTAKETQKEVSIESEKFAEATTSIGFLEAFKKLNPTMQMFILYIIAEVFLPMIISISSNLLTPSIKAYLDDNNDTKLEKIEKIRNIPTRIGIPSIEDNRFISGDNVRLRLLPSTESDIIFELGLGQVVREIASENYWVEVEYENEEGEIFNGWVYKRYVKEFNRP